MYTKGTALYKIFTDVTLIAEKNIKAQIEFLTDGIMMDGLFIVTEMTHKNISQTKYYERTLTIEELNIALKDCFYDSNLKNYRIKATRAYFRFHVYPQSIKYNKKILRISKEPPLKTVALVFRLDPKGHNTHFES